ncbi:MAG: universal stress protein [Acidobacteria bacterium]|nr:universal stress protein [Acidobacteriota bacterium]
MITKILAAYDGSEPAGHAYRLALDLAKRYGADLLVLAVASPPEPPEDIETAAVLENAEAHYKELFDALKAEAAKEGLEPRLEVVAGHPAKQIVYRAERDGVDLIVVGHRGKGFFERLLVGSVSKQVVTHAHCPVLVVR